MLVKKLPASPNLLMRNEKNTRGKQETEPPLKLKRYAEDLKPNNSHQITCSELNPKTTQSGGTKETVSGLELELGQEVSLGKTTRWSVLTAITILSGSGSSAIQINGSILGIVPETL